MFHCGERFYALVNMSNWAKRVKSDSPASGQLVLVYDMFGPIPSNLVGVGLLS